MSFKLHNLKNSQPKNKKRVGRGGKRGTYAGRGLKGQRARSGGRRGLLRLGLKTLMTQTHKLRGFKSLQNKPAVVNLSILNKYYKDGEKVSPKSLKAKGIIKSSKERVKILGNGEITRKITIEGCAVSKSVAEKLKVKI